MITVRQEDVQKYYGKDLKSSNDLKTSACCPMGAMSPHLRPLVANIDDEILSKFYGCGSPIPFVLDGLTVLDLGCGTGRDCYTLSQLVGENGRVIGVDMTEEQLEVARRHVDRQMEKFGFAKANVEFHKSFIEDLSFIEDNSVDLIISNCVINLSADKEAVFREIARVLKPGGELYFSDVFADRRVPEEMQKDQVVVGECLGGAMYIQDFRRMLSRVGLADYRVVSSDVTTLDDADVERKVGMINFTSQTIRTFKCTFEDARENYGHVAWYKGTIPECPHRFDLDREHVFKTGMPIPVCGNTAKMLSETRYGEHFRIEGDFSTHFGAFEHNDSVQIVEDAPAKGSCC